MKPSHLHIALLLAGICAAGTGQAQTNAYQFINLGSGSAAGINDLARWWGKPASAPRYGMEPRQPCLPAAREAMLRQSTTPA